MSIHLLFTYWHQEDIYLTVYLYGILDAKPSLRLFDRLIIQPINDDFLTERWAMQMIWPENWVREAMRKKSSKRNQATSLRSKSQRGSRGMEEAEVGKIRLYNPVIINKRWPEWGERIFLPLVTTTKDLFTLSIRMRQEQLLRTQREKLSNNLATTLILLLFLRSACVASWVSSLSLN